MGANCAFSSCAEPQRSREGKEVGILGANRPKLGAKFWELESIWGGAEKCAGLEAIRGGKIQCWGGGGGASEPRNWSAVLAFFRGILGS